MYLQWVSQQCLQSKHLPRLQGLPPPPLTFQGKRFKMGTQTSSLPPLYALSTHPSVFFSAKWPLATPNVSETDWWDYNNVDSYMHNGQLTVTGVRKAQCWWRRGATTGLIIGCTNMTSDPRATALVWRMMAVTNLGGIGENVRHNLWREEVKKVYVAKTPTNVSFMKDMNHFKPSTGLDQA